MKAPPKKTMNDAFYILKPFFFLKIFKFCPDFSGIVGERLDKKATVNLKICNVTT